GKETPFIIVNPIMTPKEKFDLIGRVYNLLYDDRLVDPKIDRIMTAVKKYVTKEQFEKIESEIFYEINKNNMNLIVNERSEDPLLSEIATNDLIQLNVEASNWEEAIRNATEVLVSQKKVLPSYIDGMIRIA